MKLLPSITDDFSQWYNDVVYQAELIDLSPVRGSFVIRPYGYALWENIHKKLDQKIKDTGHQNAAFPLLIPQSFLEREAKHVEGFAPELAVVTHAGGKELEEPLVIRPTSETIIHHMFAQWISSWRDLPLKINQWANIVRWEMRTRPFLRSCEILWQEGHTAHETAQEAQSEALLMLNEYIDMYETYLAIPVISGVKSETEKFAGADKTYTVETLMQDGKSLQMCTSHLISQNFAKSFGIMFQDRLGNKSYPYLTSWGFTTRSIGALVMVHGDQKGLVMPPRVAPIQVVIVPIFKKDLDNNEILKVVFALADKLRKDAIAVQVDDRVDETPGAKFYKWELKGVPVRIEIGPRDIANGTVVLSDRLGLAKEAIIIEQINEAVKKRLDLIHYEMFARAKKRLDSMHYKAAKLTDFAQDLETKGGFYQTGWCGSEKCEASLKELKATIRCLLKEQTLSDCFACNSKSAQDILVAKAY